MVWQSSASSWYFPRPLWTTRCEFKGLSLSFVSYLLQGSKRVQRNCHSLSLNSYFIVIILCLGQTVYPVAGRECYFFFSPLCPFSSNTFNNSFVGWGFLFVGVLVLFSSQELWSPWPGLRIPWRSPLIGEILHGWYFWPVVLSKFVCIKYQFNGYLKKNFSWNIYVWCHIIQNMLFAVFM